MSLSTIGCLGLILALLGASILAPIFLIGSQSTFTEPVPSVAYNDDISELSTDIAATNVVVATAIQATNWQLSTYDAAATASEVYNAQMSTFQAQMTVEARGSAISTAAPTVLPPTWTPIGVPSQTWTPSMTPSMTPTLTPLP